MTLRTRSTGARQKQHGKRENSQAVARFAGKERIRHGAAGDTRTATACCAAELAVAGLAVAVVQPAPCHPPSSAPR
jgi:hypothetical protein